MNAVAKEKPKAEVPANESGPKKKNGRKSAPVQIENELAHMANVIAANDRITLSDLLSPVLRQFLETNFERVNREIEERIRRRREEAKKG